MSLHGTAWLQPRHDGERWLDTWQFCCLGCGLCADIDADQLEGRVSIDCPECEFHETLRPRIVAAPRWEEKLLAAIDKDGEDAPPAEGER